MGFVNTRSKRSKQINVRLTDEDAQEFNAVMDYYHHQTASDSVRDMIRNGYINFSVKPQELIDKIVGNVFKPHGEDYRKDNQLNVRLSDEELEMADFLAGKMACDNTCEVIRKLINVYYVATQTKKEGDEIIQPNENTL